MEGADQDSTSDSHEEGMVGGLMESKLRNHNKPCSARSCASIAHFIGKLTLAQRIARVLNYKKKLCARRLNKPISKKFSGRSKIACQKLRVNGKFVKKSEMHLYI